MRWLLFIIFYILVDIYAFQAVKTLTKSPWLYGLYILISLAVLAGLIYELSFLGSSRMMRPPKMYFFGIFLAVFVPKLLLVIDRKSTRLNSSHVKISYAVFCLKK